MQTAATLQQLNDELRATRDNLKKDNLTRRTDPVVISRKLDELNIFRNTFNEIRIKYAEEINDKKYKEDEILLLNKFVFKIKEKFDEIDNILQQRLDYLKELNNESTKSDHKDSSSTMTENFCLKTAASLLPKMDSNNTESVYQLISGIELYDSFLNQNSKPSVINYVIKACISQRDKIRLKEKYDNIANLIKDLKEHFIPKQSATALANKLQASKQGNLSIDEYGRSIESLMSDLTIAQSENDASATEIFKKANEKVAIDVFARGLNNREIRTLIKARNYEKLSEAISAAKDENLQNQHEQNSSALLHIKSNNRGRGTFYQNKNFYRKNYQRTNTRYNNNYNNHTTNNTNSQRGRRLNNFGNRRFNHRSRPRQFYNKNNRVFIANEEPDNSQSNTSEPQQFFRAPQN